MLCASNDRLHEAPGPLLHIVVCSVQLHYLAESIAQVVMEPEADTNFEVNC